MTNFKVLMTSFILVLALAKSANAENTPVNSYEPSVFSKDIKHSAGGSTATYEMTAGETLIHNDNGEAVAAVWSVSYVGKASQSKKRPVTFVFSGGPGSATATQILGYLGPKIISIPGSPKIDDGAAPYSIIDNQESILDQTDIVFVDPIGTGYSRAIGNSENKDFWSMSKDTQSMSNFIETWIHENNRWNSPKYILGLSYGSTRAVQIANHLSHMSLNGLILLGPALNFDGSASVEHNMIGYFSNMPSMAAIAHYHGKAGQGLSLEEFTEEARKFSVYEYAPALIMGNQLSLSARKDIADRLSSFIGINSNYLLQSDLRITVPRFRKELLRKEGLVVGFMDGRYVGDEYDDTAAEPKMGDASSYRENGAYTAAFFDYFGSELGVKMDRPYKMFNPQAGKFWDWSPNLASFKDPQRYRIAKRLGKIEVATQLAKVMRQNEGLKVLAGIGYYDLATPFLDSERTFANFGIISDRITSKYYEVGHRHWANNTTRVELMDDLRKYYQTSK